MSNGAAAPAKSGTGLVILGASVGTLFEWYDFFLYGSLATFITRHFFSNTDPTTGYILALLAFFAGFLVRPLGAVIFGRLGDKWGRKNTFLVTMVLMGLATVGVSVLPDYGAWGLLAPAALIGLRLVQGLALGGEYGGAAIYVVEHAPADKRGLRSSWIQATATLGLLLSLAVVLVTRLKLGEAAFGDWGWRIPFGVSAVLLIISLIIRLMLNESPVFQRMVAEGRTSKRPLAEAFGSIGNVWRIVIALVGLVAGQAVVWYTAQFYALFFLEKVVKVDGVLTNELMAIALVVGTPFFIFAGWLSDKVGRKYVIIGAIAVAAVTVFPLFQQLTVAANPKLAQATARAPVIVVADPADCHLQFDPIGKAVFNSSCDLATSTLAKAGVPYTHRDAVAGALAQVTIGTAATPSFDGRSMAAKDFKSKSEAWGKALAAQLKAAGYPAKADPKDMNMPLVVAILSVLVILAAIAYGPLAAMLVEMFPARIRYTSMSIPYHIGNGWFGGILPSAAFALTAATGDIFYGLWYPVVIAAATAVIGLLFLRETRGADIEG
ncbi:MAG TPA: MFS transporter [Caulobacteraceae bacterium]|jgi:MFS family permease|nr:MFS transporter [Caulobacteraceae bacterium]